jgi:hypothetical protein
MSDAPPAPTPGTPPPPPSPPPPPAGGDKDALDRLNTWAQSFGAREKAEGKAAVEREVAEKLGMTLEEAAAFVTKAKEDHAASLSEAEQKLLKAEESKTEARRYREEAHDIVRRTLAADALEDLGMPRQSARHYAGMVQPAFTQGMNDDARVAAIVAAAQQLKDTYPDLFAAGGGNGRPGPTDTATRGGRPPTSQGGETPRDRAQARLRERRGGRLSSDTVPAQTEIDATRR